MKALRESASLIIAVKNGLKQSQSAYDYKVLFLRRCRNQSFGGALVFPGGVIESADADLKWHNLFKLDGHDENSFQSLIPRTKMRPQIFQSRENELPREISLRISAIRETFEECGILICKQCSKSTHGEQDLHFKLPRGELEFWQERVHCDANEFYNMCERLQCYPNLWALHEWGNWVTPTFVPVRYNTAFFMVNLPNFPKCRLEETEVDELLWATPEEIIESYQDDLMPPQKYEVLRISKHNNFDQLLAAAQETSKIGVQQILPVRVMLKNGSVHLLPGDPMYPEKVDFYKRELIDKEELTIEQFRHSSGNMHRIEFFDTLEDVNPPSKL